MVLIDRFYVWDLLETATYQIYKLWASWIQSRRLFNVILLIRLWGIYVTIATRVPIQSAQKNFCSLSSYLVMLYIIFDEN